MMVRWLSRAAMSAAALVVALAVALSATLSALPFPRSALENRARSIVVTDHAGAVMLRAVGPDDQWREPIPLESMGQWIQPATLAAEDQRFWRHGGIDPIAVLRAAGQDLTAGRIVSGASTITMQLSRMCEPRERSLRAKILQALRAVQLERSLDKHAILERYLNMTPYGSNIRGVEAASRRYFAKPASDLSIAEAALLAGIPQSPERLRPDRHPAAARDRRDWVLKRMLLCGSINQQQWETATQEPIVLTPATEPIRAPHAAWLALSMRPEGGKTTIDLSLQSRVEQLVATHLRSFPANTQIAAAVIDIQSGHLLSLVGSADPTSCESGQVDGATAFRSPGSALKPFIYAAAMDAQRLSPESIVYDIPIQRAGWSPANFSRGFSGELTAAEALRLSLNVPAILVAEGTGLQRCTRLIQSAGVHLRADAPQRGGLGLVVGAVEVRLLDLTNAYATLGRSGVFREVALFADQKCEQRRVLSSDTSATISDILSCRHRRPHGMETRFLEQIPWFCWKTGTSSGRRDAWAVGHNGRYAAGVWVGDFSGKGRVEYLGFEAAEPLLAEVLTMHELSAPRDPDKPSPVPVTRPLPLPVEVAPALRITFPARDAEFLSIAGGAIISPRSTRPGQWFLDGVLAAVAPSITLHPGRHELRCVAPTGESDSISITVK